MENQGRSRVLYFLFIFSLGFVNSQVSVATGGNFIFQPSVNGIIELFDWRHRGDLIVEWDPSGNPDPVWYRYKDRASLNVKTGELTLKMKREDSGTFAGQFQVKGELQYWKRNITVIDPLSKPKVTCEAFSTNTTLICSLDPPVKASFSWTGPNGFSEVGSSVQITRGAEDSVYYCTVTNKVSKNDTEFNLKDCPEAGEHHNEGSNAFTIAAGIIGGIIGIVVLVGGGIYVVRGKKASFGSNGAPGSMTLQVEDGNKQYEAVENNDTSINCTS